TIRTATTGSVSARIYPLSLHDALPIYRDPPPRRRRFGGHGHRRRAGSVPGQRGSGRSAAPAGRSAGVNGSPRSGGRHLCTAAARSEEHTSELQSRENLVCRLLLEKKKR